MILNVIVCAPRKILSDLRPPISELLVSLNDKHIFFLSPLILLDVWIQMIVPSVGVIIEFLPLSALLSNSSR